MGNSLTRKQIEEIYNAAPTPGQTNNTSTPSFNMSRDEIANIYNSYTPEIPKLEQNTPPTPTSDYRAEIERMNKLKADTSVPRTEGENQAIETYLNSLEEAQRYQDSNKPAVTNSSKVSKQPIGTVEIKADGTKKFTKTMSAEEKKNFENQINRRNQFEQSALTDRQAKIVGKQAKENAQPRERALSANEQRDLERAQSAIAQVKEKEREQNNPINKLKAMAEPFTNLPKKNKPQYDDRGFEINPSITDNQGTVDEYLDPNKKLSKADEKKAKQLIKEYEQSDLGQKNENATTLVFDDAHPDGRMVPSYTVDENGVYHPYLELTPEERQYQQSIGALKTKVDNGESFLVGSMKTIPFVDALMLAGDRNGEYARMTANSQKQNPLAYTAGLLTGGVMANTAGRFALGGTQYGDWLEKTLGADKNVGRRILTDALMDAPVDVATDIIPTLAVDIASDKSARQVIGSTALNTALNAGFNLGGALISNAGDIIGSVKKVPERAFEDPIKQLEGVDYFKEMADRTRAVDDMKWLEAQRNAALANGFDFDYQGVPVEYNGSFEAPEKLVHSLTNEQVSPEYAAAVRKLESGQSITSEEYNAIPEVITGKERIGKAGTETYLDKSPEREMLRQQWLEDLKAKSGSATKAVVDGKHNRNIAELSQNEKRIVSLNPDLNNAADAELFKTVENNSAIDVKSVKAANKQLDDKINSLANMFGKQKNNEGVVALKEALNDYAETGSEEALTKARRIAQDMDDYYSGATYKSRKGNITEFGSNGTFTSQVDDFADKLRSGATIKSEPLHVTDLDKRINDLFSKYDLSAEDAESVRAWKQAINDYMANPTEEGWDNLLAATSDVSRRGNNLSEYVLSYKGKTKTNPFDQHELVSIMDEIDTRRPLSSGVPNVPEQTVKNVPPVNNFPEGTGELVERGTSKHIRNDGTPMRIDVPEEVKESFIEDQDMYNRLTNAETLARANEIYDQGGDVETKFRDLLNKKDPASLALGHRLAKDYSAAGEYEKAAQIYRDMGKELTQAGQFSQAAILAMTKNDPLTALYYAQKEIDAINTSGAKKYGKKWKDFALTPEEIEAFNKIQPGDEKTIAELYDQIGVRIGKDYPATFLDKLLEGRRVLMLFNLRTNIRNICANVPTLGMRWASDRVDALGQNIAHLIDPNFKVTNSLKGAGFKGRKLATQWLKSDEGQKLLKSASGKGKYSPDITSSLLENKQVFKGTRAEKWINKMTGGGIEKVNEKLFGKKGVESGLETIRNATYKALELGDDPFVKENFVERLGSYINAQGIKSLDEIPDDAIQTAWEEAMKATYKDNSWAVKMLRGMKNGLEEVPVVGRPLSQAAIPFLQAPGNIAARMVDYSPIRGAKGVADIISGAKNLDQNTVRRGIEEVSKSLTGTGMVVLGMKLKESGLITGNYSEDKDQKNFQKMKGFKPYALHIGNKYFSYDWAQPFAEPMIIGTLLQEAIDNSDQYDSDILKYFGYEDTGLGNVIGATKEGVKASFNSWFNASPLQGMADLLKGDYTGQSDVAQNVYDTAVTGFAGAFIPSLSNAIAKSVDPIQRNTTDPSNAFGTFLNAQAAKIPWLSDNLPAAYDTWGEEKKYANSKGEAFAQRFIVPGDYGIESDDPIDNEINRLFEETADNRVFPTTAPTSVDGVKLNNREVSEYQEDMGQRSREIVETLMDSDYYDDLSESNKAETLNTIYSVSKAITERDLFDKAIPDNSQYKKAIAAYDEGGAEGLMSYLEGKAITNDAGVSTTSKAGKIIQDRLNMGDKKGAQALANDITTLDGYGISTYGKGTYADRGSYNYNAEQYSRMFSQIDTGENGQISQAEIKDFFEKNNIKDPKQMQRIWEAFLTDYTPGESTVPYYDTESKTVKYGKPPAGFKSTIPSVEPTPETNTVSQEEEWDKATLSDDPYTAIAQSGVGHGNEYMDKAWDKAVLADPNLTPQQFIKEWSVVDKDKSGSHSQQEIVDHMNSAKMDKEKGELFLAKYWSNGWKKKAKLDNNGNWYYS